MLVSCNQSRYQLFSIHEFTLQSIYILLIYWGEWYFQINQQSNLSFIPSLTDRNQWLRNKMAMIQPVRLILIYKSVWCLMWNDHSCGNVNNKQSLTPHHPIRGGREWHSIMATEKKIIICQIRFSSKIYESTLNSGQYFFLNMYVCMCMCLHWPNISSLIN